MGLTIKEIDKQISELKAQRRKLEEQEREKIKADAQKYVGKCFKVRNKDYVKIIGAPQEEYTMINVIFNQYQFPAIWIVDDELVPFVEDDFNISNLINVNSPFHLQYKQITNKEFSEEFNKRLQEFKEKIGV